MKKLLIVMSVLSLLLLCGCGKKADAKATQPSIEIVTPTGAGEAVVPEEGDIVIPINP